MYLPKGIIIVRQKHFPRENRENIVGHMTLNMILCFRLFARVHFHKQEQTLRYNVSNLMYYALKHRYYITSVKIMQVFRKRILQIYKMQILL